MSAKVRFLPHAIAELFAKASTSGSITIADQYGLRAALAEASLSEEERSYIDRLLYAVRRGWLQVIDEVSSVG
jgi:hypothetical protein